MRDVLVAATTEAKQHCARLGPASGFAIDPGDRVRRLERGNDALEPSEQPECRESLVIVDRIVLHSSGIVQPAVFRPDAGIVKTGRHRVCWQDLAIGILQEVR